MSNERPLYALLEVPMDATADEIRRTYHRLALRYHPDRAGPDGEEQFKKVQGAYALLSDPEARAVYDRYGEQGLSNIETVPVMKEVGNQMSAISFFRFLFAVLTIVFSLLLIFFVLLAMKLDDKIEMSWYWVPFPIYILFAVFVIATFVSIAFRLRKYYRYYMCQRRCREQQQDEEGQSATPPSSAEPETESGTGATNQHKSSVGGEEVEEEKHSKNNTNNSAQRPTAKATAARGVADIDEDDDEDGLWRNAPKSPVNFVHVQATADEANEEKVDEFLREQEGEGKTSQPSGATVGSFSPREEGRNGANKNKHEHKNAANTSSTNNNNGFQSSASAAGVFLRGACEYCGLCGSTGGAGGVGAADFRNHSDRDPSSCACYYARSSNERREKEHADANLGGNGGGDGIHFNFAHTSSNAHHVVFGVGNEEGERPLDDILGTRSDERRGEEEEQQHRTCNGNSNNNTTEKNVGGTSHAGSGVSGSKFSTPDPHELRKLREFRFWMGHIMALCLISTAVLIIISLAEAEVSGRYMGTWIMLSPALTGNVLSMFAIILFRDSLHMYGIHCVSFLDMVILNCLAELQAILRIATILIIIIRVEYYTIPAIYVCIPPLVYCVITNIFGSLLAFMRVRGVEKIERELPYMSETERDAIRKAHAHRPSMWFEVGAYSFWNAMIFLGILLSALAESQVKSMSFCVAFIPFFLMCGVTVLISAFMFVCFTIFIDTVDREEKEANLQRRRDREAAEGTGADAFHHPVPPPSASEAERRPPAHHFNPQPHSTRSQGDRHQNATRANSRMHQQNISSDTRGGGGGHHHEPSHSHHQQQYPQAHQSRQNVFYYAASSSSAFSPVYAASTNRSVHTNNNNNHVVPPASSSLPSSRAVGGHVEELPRPPFAPPSTAKNNNTRKNDDDARHPNLKRGKSLHKAPTHNTSHTFTTPNREPNDQKGSGGNIQKTSLNGSQRRHHHHHHHHHRRQRSGGSSDSNSSGRHNHNNNNNSNSNHGRSQFFSEEDSAYYDDYLNNGVASVCSSHHHQHQNQTQHFHRNHSNNSGVQSNNINNTPSNNNKTHTPPPVHNSTTTTTATSSSTRHHHLQSNQRGQQQQQNNNNNNNTNNAAVVGGVHVANNTLINGTNYNRPNKPSKGEGAVSSSSGDRLHYYHNQPPHEFTAHRSILNNNNQKEGVRLVDDTAVFSGVTVTTDSKRGEHPSSATDEKGIAQSSDVGGVGFDVAVVDIGDDF